MEKEAEEKFLRWEKGGGGWEARNWCGRESEIERDGEGLFITVREKVWERDREINSVCMCFSVCVGEGEFVECGWVLVDMWLRERVRGGQKKLKREC